MTLPHNTKTKNTGENRNKSNKTKIRHNKEAKTAKNDKTKQTVIPGQKRPTTKQKAKNKNI